MAVTLTPVQLSELERVQESLRRAECVAASRPEQACYVAAVMALRNRELEILRSGSGGEFQLRLFQG